jgi:hypothetical protein
MRLPAEYAIEGSVSRAARRNAIGHPGLASGWAAAHIEEHAAVSQGPFR